MKECLNSPLSKSNPKKKIFVVIWTYIFKADHLRAKQPAIIFLWDRLARTNDPIKLNKPDLTRFKYIPIKLIDLFTLLNKQLAQKLQVQKKYNQCKVQVGSSLTQHRGAHIFS